jgi:hypothetical protein
MPFSQDRFSTPVKAASNIGARRPVTLVSSASISNPSSNPFPVSVSVITAATNNVRPFGVLGPENASQGQAVAVYEDLSTVKVTAAASFGINGEVGVASTNGDIGPVAAASGVAVWAVGIALENAVAGEVGSVYVRPRQISGLV